MSDFVKEIKLSYKAYYCWQEIKDEIGFKMNMYDEKILLYTFKSNDIMKEIVEFLNEKGFEVIIGEEVWNNNIWQNTKYDKIGFKHYCEYDWNGSDFSKKDSPDIPCIIKW